MAVVLVGPALLGAGLLWWWLLHRPPAPVAPVEPAAAPAAVPASPAVTPAPPTEHPIETVRGRLAAEDATAASQPATVADELRRLLGPEILLRRLQLDDFARRFVATVDNLGRDAAPAQIWPLTPTEGRFRVLERDGQVVIDPDNGLRYAPFVQLVESVDTTATVTAYARIYPELQRAYEQLGFPGRHFNTRLVQVIDLLLATPVPDGPLEVVLPEVRGPIQPPRPWVLYEFADPSLRALTAGQQWLLRLGPVNQRRLQARLAEFRVLLARPPAPANR